MSETSILEWVPSMSRCARTAVFTFLLGAASLLAPTGVLGPENALAAEPSPGKQVEQTLQVGDASVKYLMYLPPAYEESQDAFPLVLFLHGRGRPLARAVKRPQGGR